MCGETYLVRRALSRLVRPPGVSLTRTFLAGDLAADPHTFNCEGENGVNVGTCGRQARGMATATRRTDWHTPSSGWLGGTPIVRFFRISPVYAVALVPGSVREHCPGSGGVGGAYLNTPQKQKMANG